MNHGTSKKRLREWSLDELQEEIRKRQRRVEEGKQRCRGETGTADDDQAIEDDSDFLVHHGPDASTVSLIVAIDKLSKLFDSLVSKCRNRYNHKHFVFPSEHASFLLKTHPSIVLEAFKNRTVLSYFLQANSPLAIVKEVCQMYKDQVKSNPISNGQGNCYNFYRTPNAIGDACLYGPGAKGVLQHLVEEFPEQILQKDKQGRLPMDLLLNRVLELKPDEEFKDYAASPRRVSYPTLEILEAACPNMFEYCQNSSLYLSKLMDTFNVSHETKILLFERFAQASNVESLIVTRKAGTIAVAEIMSISKVLPLLKVCSLMPRDMYEEASRIFNASLYSSDVSNLVELGMPILPDYHAENEENGGKFLTLRALKNCRNLKKLSLQCVGYSNRSYHDTCVKLCTDILKGNPGIESLELHNFRLKNSATLSEFLSSVTNIKHLVLNNFRCESRWCICEIKLGSKLETLQLTADVKSPWVGGLLLQLAKDAPGLKTLVLGHYKKNDDSEVPDLTNILSAVLELNRVVVFETSSDCAVDMDRICSVLKTNDTLEHLVMPGCKSLTCQELADTFEHHNTTVKHIEAGMPRVEDNPNPPAVRLPAVVAAAADAVNYLIVDFSSDDDDSDMSVEFGREANNAGVRNEAQPPPVNPEAERQQTCSAKISYCVMLNRFGRAKAQDAKTSTAELVDLLCEVANEPSFEVDPQMRHNIQMGLLLSAPNIWAGASE